MTRDELANELMEDARIEDLLESDYDYFCEYYVSDIKLFVETYRHLKKLHDTNAWEFDIEELLDANV